MVQYLTSANVRLLRKICDDYEGRCGELSAFEYMKSYVEQCPESVAEEELTWLAETFLGLQRHHAFLLHLCARLRGQLFERDAWYMRVLLYAVLFQLQPDRKDSLLRCAAHLGAPLLRRFCAVFANNEVLPYVSQIACLYYDASYVTDNIVAPLFSWQPYIGEMLDEYEACARKTRRPEPPTTPSQARVPIVRNRPQPRSTPPTSPLSPAPRSPQPSFTAKTPAKKMRMLTKSAIDLRLQRISQQNRERATKLLDRVKAQEFHYLKNKSAAYYDAIANVENETKTCTRLPPARRWVRKRPAPVKENVASVKRLGVTVDRSERQDLQWMTDVLVNCRDTAGAEIEREKERRESERELKEKAEKCRLTSQLAYEEAILAKHQVMEDNKKKYADLVAEKEVWLQEIERWKAEEMRRNREAVEKLSLQELRTLEAKQSSRSAKQSAARGLKQETALLLSRALAERNEELERRVDAIKQMKVLSLVARSANAPRAVDLTESSGIGLLCEMSLAELQERLAGMKMRFKEQLEEKKRSIRGGRERARLDLEATRTTIERFLSERSASRAAVSAAPVDCERVRRGRGSGDLHNNEHIARLRQTLELKRKERHNIAASKKN